MWPKTCTASLGTNTARERLLAMILKSAMRPDIDPTVVRTTRAWWTPICSCSWTAAKFRNADAARRTAVRHAMSAGADGGYKHRVAVDVEREVGR